MRWRDTWKRAVWVLVLPTTGCGSLLADAQGGVVSSTRFESERTGFAAHLSAGGMLGDEGAENFGPGLALHAKITEDVKQFSITPHLYYLSVGEVTPYLRAGTNIAQFESVDGDGSFGMFSPYGEAGVFYGTLVISAFAEYDLRFSDNPNEGFMGLMLGWGFAQSTTKVRTEFEEFTR